MALPYPGKVYVPFDILTAQELNEDVANIESLAAGTGFNTGAIPTAALANISVTTAKINDGAVTAPKIADDTWNQTVNAIAYNATITGTWTRLATTGTGGLSVSLAQSGGAQNEEVQFKILLTAGTYTILIHHDKDVNRGIYTIFANGVSQGTTDGYSGTRLAGTVSQITNSYILSSSSLVDFRVRMATKNASSAGYYANFYDLQFIRTS